MNPEVTIVGPYKKSPQIPGWMREAHFGYPLKSLKVTSRKGSNSCRVAIKHSKAGQSKLDLAIHVMSITKKKKGFCFLNPSFLDCCVLTVEGC